MLWKRTLTFDSHARAILERLESFVINRLGRPYYPLDDGWGLTHLNTGQPFFVNTRDRQITPWILMGGHWEPSVDRVISAYLQPGMRVLDIGANMGYYTIKMASIVGHSGCVLAFEPNPVSARYAEANIHLNGFSHFVQLHQLALGNVAGEARMSYSSDAPGNASLNHRDRGSTEHEISIPVNTLDTIIQAGKVDFIKLDAEGYEPYILDGAHDTLKNNPNSALMVELSRHRWELVRPLDDIYDLVGHHRSPFVVTPEGRLRHISRLNMRNFLDSCLFSENYVLFVPDEMPQTLVSILD